MIRTEPQRYHVELIDGRDIEKPLPKKLHILIQRFLIVVLTGKLPSRYLAMPELNVLTGGRTENGRREYVIPDIAVTDRLAKYEDGDLAEPPVWAVEILSPGQTIGDLFVRAERLLKMGTPMVWVIWPDRRRVWMYTQSELIEAVDTLRAYLPETHKVEILTSEMWAELD